MMVENDDRPPEKLVMDRIKMNGNDSKWINCENECAPEVRNGGFRTIFRIIGKKEVK